LFVYAALKLVTVKKEKRFHGGMANPLVSVNECVVHNQRVAKGCGLGNEVGVKIQPAEDGVRLTDCGFESAKVSNTRGTA